MNSNKKTNKVPYNVFAVGGNILPLGLLTLNAPSISVNPSNIQMNSSLGGSFSPLGGNNMMSGVMGAAGGAMDLVTDTISNFNPKIPEVTINPTTSSATNNDSLMSEWSEWTPAKYITTKDLGGTKNGALSALGGAGKGASAGMSFGPLGAAIGGVVGGLAGGLGSLFGNNKKKRAVDKINTKIDNANMQSLSNFQSRASGLDTQSDWRNMANFSAFGGPLFNTDSALNYGLIMDAMTPVFEDKEYKNTFDTGGFIGQFTDPELPGFSPFTHGGYFNNGVTIFGDGGTHEENILGGIPLGIGENGLPNLVEEGEVKYNDYIYSNRVKANKTNLNEMNLPIKYAGKTIADIAKDVSKESEERPNDPISKKGLETSMMKLMGLLELLRESEDTNVFAKGGKKTSRKNKVTPFTINATSPTLMTLKEFESLGGKGSVNDFYKTNLTSYATPEEITGVPQLTYSYINPNYQNFVNQGTPTQSPFSLDLLRYAPILGSAIGLGNAIFGGYTPDLSGAETIGGLSVSPTPVGNYLEYNPFDRNYYLNMLNALAGATRRGVVNLSGGNRATATAGLLAADSNYLNAVGALGRQAEEYNAALRERVEGFNRGTNMFNSELEFKADLTNNDYIAKAAELKSGLNNQAKQIRQLSLSTNLTNLFDNIGDVGREEFSRNMIESNPSLLYDINRSGQLGYKKKDGGKLNKKKGYSWQ